jgi:hypothetical protein
MHGRHLSITAAVNVWTSTLALTTLSNLEVPERVLLHWMLVQHL